MSYLDDDICVHRYVILGVGTYEGNRGSTVYDVLPNGFPHVPHVGRLDKETEGLLLFTDDGDLRSANPYHNRNRFPKNHNHNHSSNAFSLQLYLRYASLIVNRSYSCCKRKGSKNIPRRGTLHLFFIN